MRIVTVLPITRSLPADPAIAVETPARSKNAVVLTSSDAGSSSTRATDFLGPGRKIPAPREFHYGFLPPCFLLPCSNKVGSVQRALEAGPPPDAVPLSSPRAPLNAA